MVVTPTLLWLLAGLGLCALELFLPTAFTAFVMGLSAIAVSLISLVLPDLGLQVFLWMVLSLVLVLGTRRFFPPSRSAAKLDALEGETLTEILPGKSGRVLYEGNSWQARCDDHDLTIASGQRVYIVRREGTTLIVMPENLLQS